MVFLGKEIHERRDYSEKTAEVIDQEISNYVEEAAKTAERVIKENENKIKDIVKVLIAKETIEKADFDSIMA